MQRPFCEIKTDYQGDKHHKWFYELAVRNLFEELQKPHIKNLYQLISFELVGISRYNHFDGA
jgi:hypothetical protein